MSKQEIYTHYANTDLEINSNREPLALKAVFHEHQFLELTERMQKDGSWLGRYETYKQHKEPDANLAGFLEVIEDLEGAALAEWQQCTRREFDIGCMAGYEPFCFSQMLSVSTISKVVKAGAVIRISVYAADPKAAPPSTTSQKKKKK